MKEKGIKNLIIDFGGVLIDLDRQRCIENFAKLGMPNVEAMLDVCNKDFLQRICYKIHFQRFLPLWCSYKNP